MKVFAISDLHLSDSVNKPMDIFGDEWLNHMEKISSDWKEKVSDDDLVLIGGDVSWAMTIDDAKADFDLISSLPGKKIFIRGNHDYYWSGINKMRSAFKELNFIQNDAIRFEDETCGIVVCGLRGWMLPNEIESEHDKKIYQRELLRLEMSLNAAKRIKKENDKVICMLHYPPFEPDYSDSDVTAIIEKFDVDVVLYGHLHGKNVKVTKKYVKHGITYLLTSCDLIDFKLIEIDL